MMPAARVLLLCVIIGLLSLTTTSVTVQSYEECFTNYTVLERAVIATDDNRYSIIKAFYPPETTLSAVYVTVTYVTSDHAANETWIWTKAPIYLIQPPSVFQYSALLFNYHLITNRITKLTVTLPPTCCNASVPVACYKDEHTHCNNKYLDVLTNELYLYAMNDGRNSRIILNEVPSTSMRNHMNCSPDIERAKPFYFFNLFCVVFPFVMWILMAFIVKSCRPRIRSIFGSPFRRSGVNQNYAALILTGMVFATFVLMCDMYALVNAFEVNSDLNELDHYEPIKIHNLTKFCVLTVAIIDFGAFIISVLIFIFLCCNACCGKNCWCDNCFVCGLWCFFTMCCCKLLDCGFRAQNKLDYSIIPEEGVEAHLRTKRKINKENMQWLLLVSFLAPVVCIGTHSAPVIMAWSSDTDNASSMTMMFLLSFFYYFFGFRQLYIVLASCPKIKNCAIGDNNKCCLSYRIEDVPADVVKHEKYIQEYNFKVLICEIPVGVILVGIQLIIIFTYFYLPAPVSTVPLNIVNVFHLALIVGGGLIAYKVLTIHKPKIDVILEKIVYSFTNDKQNSANTNDGATGQHPDGADDGATGQRPEGANGKSDVIDPASKLGEILGEVLKKIIQKVDNDNIL